MEQLPEQLISRTLRGSRTAYVENSKRNSANKVHNENDSSGVRASTKQRTAKARKHKSAQLQERRAGTRRGV